MTFYPRLFCVYFICEMLLLQLLIIVLETFLVVLKINLALSLLGIIFISV